jgi:hypothetical protein
VDSITCLKLVFKNVNKCRKISGTCASGIIRWWNIRKRARFSAKVIKIPSRGPDALRYVLNDFEANANGLSFLNYYDAKGEKYFYEMLKPLADTTNLQEADFVGKCG